MEPLRAGDPRQVGRYTLVGRLGSGGMGSVYLGLSPAGRRVAVKVVHAALAVDPVFRTRFAREVQAARLVSGAYTAPVVDAGTDGPLWLATALVMGPTLAGAAAQHGPLDETSLWRLAAGLAEALGEVHARGLVHRDLKPSNVMLADDGPRVIDFGIARALDGTKLTDPGTVMGTLAYMSPEQAKGDHVGPGSDVFAFGGVLTFAGTCRAPFGEGDAVALLYRIAHGEPVLDGLPDTVAGLARRCLAKRPEDRASLAEVLEAVTANVTAADAAGSFWPDALADVIDSHRARLTGGPGTSTDEGPAEASNLDTAPGPGPAAVIRPPLAQSSPPPELGPTQGTRRRLPRLPRRLPRLAAAAVAVVIAAAAVTVALLHGGPPAKPSRAAVVSPVPALSRGAAQRVLTAFTATYNRANMLRSDSLLATTETGAAYRMDAGSNRWYRVSSPGHKNWASVSLKGQALYIPRQPPGAYPRWFAAKVTWTPRGAAPGPMYALFVQPKKGAAWKASYADSILASPAPAIAVDKRGYAEQVPPGDARLSVSPGKLAAVTASSLDGKGAKVTDPWSGGYADRSDQQFWHDHGFDSAKGAIDADIHFPTTDRVFGLRTESGGALVFYSVATQLTLGMPGGKSFQIKIPGYYTYATSQTSAEVDYVEQFATYDPPHGAPSVIAARSGPYSRG